jgi:hypothetical protein
VDPNRRAFRRSTRGGLTHHGGFPRKSNGDDHRGNGEEQTGECLLQRNEVGLTTPDEERSAQGVKDSDTRTGFGDREHREE